MSKSKKTTAERLAALFPGHERAHGTHGVPRQDGLKWEIKTTAKTLHEPATLAHWEQHLAGKRPLGVIPITTSSTCLWASIDVDEYDADMSTIVRRVEEARLPLVPGRSKSGGLHLFLFLKEPAPAGDVQSALHDAAARLGLAGSEIFPKQREVLTERGDVGNWMVMPYYGDTYGGKIREQVGLKRTGAEQTIEEFLTLAERSRVADLDALRGPVVAQSRPSAKSANGAAPPASPFADGPPCLQNMAATGFPEGGRNNSLFMIGLYLKRADPSRWQERLEKVNRDMMTPPLTADEVTGCVRALEKKDYNYTCKTEPMASHCNSALCRGRKYGVGAANEYPRLSGLTKLDTTPPLWFVDVENKRIELTTDDLQNYPKFQKLCMETVHICYRSMRQDAWLQIVAEAMTSLEIMDAPSEVGIAGRFREMLEDFCTNRQRGQVREDLLSGRPWEDEEHGRHYFRLRDLQDFVLRAGERNMTRGQVTTRIRAMGGEPGFFNLKGRGTNVWWVPSSAVEQTPRLDAPQIEGEKI